MKSTIIAIVNQKGGVGKTTTTVNLGAGLARNGCRVLAIDADPQASMTIGLGNHQPDLLPVSMAEVMAKAMNDMPISDGEGILHHPEGIDFLPSNISLAGTEVSLVNAISREATLKHVLNTYRKSYDYILIDCMPSLGMLTIPTATINNLIYKANENELIAKIDWLYKEGKIIRLLESIEAYANKGDLKNIPAERAAILIRCLCQMWSSFEVEEEGLITIPFAWRLLFCINPLLGTINTVDRVPFLQNIFKDKMVKPSVLALLLQDFERQHGRCTDKGPSEDKKLISLEELLMLESLFKSRCIEAIDSGAALSQYKGLSFLWLLSQVDGKLAKRIKETLVTDDISLVKVISCCTSHGRMVVGLVVKTRQVDKKSLNEFIDVEEAYQRIDAFVTTRGFLQLPIEEQKDVIAFIVTMKKDENNSQIDGPIAEDIIKEKLEKITKAIYVKA